MTPTATSATQTSRKRIGFTVTRRASGSKQSAAAVARAPKSARRVRHCWPNQPKTGPVTMPPTRTWLGEPKPVPSPIASESGQGVNSTSEERAASCANVQATGLNRHLIKGGLDRCEVAVYRADAEAMADAASSPPRESHPASIEVVEQLPAVQRSRLRRGTTPERVIRCVGAPRCAPLGRSAPGSWDRTRARGFRVSRQEPDRGEGVRLATLPPRKHEEHRQLAGRMDVQRALR
jgi:hypothetical protein